mmetsp:Transcript_93965/g.298296  ORF Transcript_93965/g.298296 Transcript_93965/m.298296 type:complete len:267 (-) Transcript_93965:33-833(-)
MTCCRCSSGVARPCERQRLRFGHELAGGSPWRERRPDTCFVQTLVPRPQGWHLSGRLPAAEHQICHSGLARAGSLAPCGNSTLQCIEELLPQAHGQVGPTRITSQNQERLWPPPCLPEERPPQRRGRRQRQAAVEERGHLVEEFGGVMPAKPSQTHLQGRGGSAAVGGLEHRPQLSRGKGKLGRLALVECSQHRREGGQVLVERHGVPVGHVDALPEGRPQQCSKIAMRHQTGVVHPDLLATPETQPHIAARRRRPSCRHAVSRDD